VASTAAAIPDPLPDAARRADRPATRDRPVAARRADRPATPARPLAAARRADSALEALEGRAGTEIPT